ncbi:zinc finger protein 106-like isoform X2 [Lineus longissimus]|uniref:zinc finger protein 106-like isoform X2 n=1 Tax=Lineus longissimus TaxID=88925 RepID=UPI002B4E6044
MAEDTENSDKTCDLCHISYFNDEELKEHSYSLMHHIKIEQKKKGSVHHCTLCFGTYSNLALYSTHLNEEKHRSAVQAEKKGKEKELDFTKPNNIETASQRSGSQKSLGSTQDKDKSFSSTGTKNYTRPGRGTFETFHSGPNNRSSSTLNSTIENLSDINTSSFESDNWNKSGAAGNWSRHGEAGNWRRQGVAGNWSKQGGPGDWNRAGGPNYTNRPRGAGSSWYGSQWFSRPKDRSYMNPTWSSNNSGNRNQSFIEDNFNYCGDYQDFTSDSRENFCVPAEPEGPLFQRDWRLRGSYKGNLRQQGRGGSRSGSKTWISPKSASTSKSGKGKVSPRDGIKGRKCPNEKSKKSRGSKKKMISPKIDKRSTHALLDRSRCSIQSGDEVSSTTRNEASKGWRDTSGGRVGASLSGGRYVKSNSPARASSKRTPKAPSRATSSERKSQDKGSALLTRAEDLCRAVRKTRKESKERTESELRKVESLLVETKIQSYSDLRQSQMKGYVSTDMLSDLDKSILELTSAQSESTVDLSKDLSEKKKETNLDVNKETSNEKVVVMVESKDSNGRKERELNNNEKSPVKDKVQRTPASSSQSVRKDATKTVAKPAVDTAKVNFVKQNVAPLNKNNLMKIINAPRSHKERMQLAHLMKSSKPKSVRPKLNLQPQEPAVVTELAESVSNEFGVSDTEFIAFESLPDDLRIKVENLLNKGPDNLNESVEMCFSDIEGVEYPFAVLDNCTMEAPLVELPDVNLNGKRRRPATSSTETLTRVDSIPQLDNKKQKIDEHDHSSVEVSLPPNNQRPVRDLDPGSTTDCSSRGSQPTNKNLSSSYTEWTRKNDLSPARNLSGSTGPHSVGSSHKTMSPVKTYSGSSQSHSSHASNDEKAQSGTTYTFGSKSFIPPFTGNSHSNSSLGLAGSKSPLRFSGTANSPFAYSNGDSTRESRSPPVMSVKREPVWEEGYGVIPSTTANYTSTQATNLFQKTSQNFQTSSIFSSNFSLRGATSQAAEEMNRHSRTSSCETDSTSITMTPSRSRTATDSTLSSGRPSIENSLGKAGRVDSSYYTSGQNRSSPKPMDHQSYQSSSSHSHSSSASKLQSSSMTSAPSSMPSALTSTPSASVPMPFDSTIMTSATTSMPSAVRQKSPPHSRSSSSPSEILSPKSALTSASQALETANTALASINTNLSFNIPVQDISTLELDASASALSGTSDPINRVLQITIKEEEIRNKLSTVNNHVETLGSLMRKLQGEFDKFKTLQTKLETEGQNLRRERLSILQGAVAEKQVSDMVKEVTSGIRKPTETSPTQSRRSTPKDGETDSVQAQSVSEPSSTQSSFSIPGIMPLPNAESSPVKVKEEVVPEIAMPPAPVIQLRTVPEPQQIVVQPAAAAPEIVADAQIPSTSSISGVDFSLKQEPEELETDPHLSKQTDQYLPEQAEHQSVMPAIFPNAVIKQEGTVPPDTCTPVEMEYVGSLKTANEAQDLLKEIASNLKDTSFIIVEGGEYLKRSKDQALAKSKDVGVQMAGNSGISTTDYDSSLSDLQVVELTPKKDPELLRDILKSPDAHCADNSYDQLLKKDTFNEKERFKALLLETVDTSMKLGVTPEEPDSSDTSPTKIAIAVKEKALKECHVVLERLDKDLMGMMDCTSTSGISSAWAKTKSKKVKGDESPMIIHDSPTLRRKMKKTKKERNRSRANVADSSSETQMTESEYTVSRTTNSECSVETTRDQLRKSGVCFTASDVEALGSSANVSFDVGVDLGEDDTSTLLGSQTTEFGPAEESQLTVTSSSDVDSYQMQDRLKISSQTASIIRNKLLQSAMVEVKQVKNVPTPGLFEGHTLPVFAMQIFENFLFSCSQDATVRKFDISSHQCVNEFHFHTKPIHCLHVTRCGSKFRERLFTGATDALLLEHDALTGEFLSRVMMADKLHCMHEQWNMLYIGLDNGQVICYDLLKSKVTDYFACGEKPISCITSSKEGPRKILLVASFDSSITVRDAKNGLLLRSIGSHLKTPLTVIEKDNSVYSGSSDRTIRLHKLNSGISVLTMTMTGPVTALALSGKYLLAASYDGVIRCYNTEDSFKLKQIYYGAGKTLIMDMILHQDLIYTANREGTIEAIPFDLSLRYPCKFRDCGVTFGLSADLRYHIFHDHLPVQIKDDRYHCNWHGCFDKLDVETNKKNLEDHISGHISEVEGTVCSESP